ncbi:MAG: hypothetical protein JNJ54_10030 [Myxococcaceae bacterium]|nr:hypothetical protein [Myxococcaceae bacterium]
MSAARKLVLIAICSAASLARAEAGWLTARGRLLPETRIEAFAGTRSFGVGVVRTDDANARAGVSFEAVVGFLDRDLEVRGARVWQLGSAGFATASIAVGGAAFLVPDRTGPDGGLGPHGALSLSLGGRLFSVDLSLQTGAELFLRAPALLRLPQRAALGLHVRVGEFTIALMARTGADVIPGRSFVGRGEVMIGVSWLGFDQAIGRTSSGVSAGN